MSAGLGCLEMEEWMEEVVPGELEEFPVDWGELEVVLQQGEGLEEKAE